MDDLDYSSSYSSGWKRIYREKFEKETQKIAQMIDQAATEAVYRGIPVQNMITYDNNPLRIAELKSSQIHPAIDKKAPEDTLSVDKPEEVQETEILKKLNQLQFDMLSIKQLLKDIQDGFAKLSEAKQKKNSESKLSKFFK